MIIHFVICAAPGFLELLLSAKVCMLVCVCVCVCVFACVCVCVCPPPRLFITSTPYDWLNMFYGFYMVTVVGIVSGHDISIYTCRGN